MIQELILISELLRARSSTLTPSEAARNGSPSRPSVLDKWRGTTTTTTAPKPEPIKGKTFAESLTELTYPEGWDPSKVVVTLDPATVAAFKEQERVKQALR
tara:strand:+ start:163 stop:465 length:303 start_codon:yes stop_codon:yes gene_type:complete